MKIVVELPFPLPTWNRILAMHHWERKKLRDLIHAAVSQLSVIDSTNTTLTHLQLKPSWMVLYGADYYRMIRPSTSRRSHLKAGGVRRTRKGR